MNLISILTICVTQVILLLVALVALVAAKPQPPPAPGSFRTVDVDDAKVKEIAAFAATAISGNGNVVRVIEAKAQTVAGVNYRIKLEPDDKICTVQVFDQSWTKTRQVNDFSCVPLTAPSASTGERVSRQAIPAPVIQQTGTFNPADVTDPKVAEIAAFAAAEMSKPPADAMTVLKVNSVARQLVGGINYKIDMQVQQAGNTLNCEVVVNDQARINKRDLLRFSCTPATSRSV